MSTPFASEAAEPAGEAVRYRAVRVEVAPPALPRRRLSVAFRWVLALPHLIIVGGFGAWWQWGDHSQGSGALMAAAGAMAFVSWFAVVFAGTQPRGLWEFTAYALRWWVRVGAYLSLATDDYPPFGDGAYAATCVLEGPPPRRDRLSVALRLLLALPQLLVLIAVDLAWFVVVVVTWVSVVLTGRAPAGAIEFSVGALRWTARVMAYVMLLTDDYPPFALAP